MSRSRLFPAILSLLTFAGFCPAQSVTIPAKVQIDQPGIVVVRATAIDADDCRFWCMGPGIQTFPSDVVQPKLGVFVGLALREGTYRIGVVGAKTIGGKSVIGEPSYCTVVVGAPGPEPGPNPPVPPPEPTDPLFPVLRNAWTVETSQDRVAQKAKLAALYRQAAGQLDGLPTMGDWSAFMGRAIKAASLDTQLRTLQRTIGDEFNLKLPRTPSAPLDKALVAAQLTRMAALLEALK